MLKPYWKGLVLITMFLVLFLAACSGEDVADSSSGETDSGSTNAGSEDTGESINYTIYGIEPGAGINLTTEAAMEQYGLDGWQFEQSSTTAMTVELEKALNNEEPIIITAWSPHWLFAKYPDLKVLEDPKNIYGEPGDIVTLVRLGLEEDNPEAFKIMEQVYWSLEDREEVILEAEESGVSIEEVTKQWVADNPDKVAEWTEGVDDVDGVPFKLTTNHWESDLPLGYALVEVMEQKGFNVELTPLDVGVMIESVANGDMDAVTGVWMPITHKDYYEANKDKFIEVGKNLDKGTMIGLAVPGYMDIDSIEDLEAK
ncbi:glycine betaine ABC transporter substrate-binding protein [Oceanobacillus sp. FSL K6-2867]|uniref:glycine betaine ABC transporter substrate-binding protein n=1 Tax=Oceanobacillus sp. FSL K6-2867 TaxID=2954748 RepID=UPI0030D71CE6